MNFDDDEDNLDVLKGNFREYCEPRKNIKHLRHIFFTRVDQIKLCHVCDRFEKQAKMLICTTNRQVNNVV